MKFIKNLALTISILFSLHTNGEEVDNNNRFYIGAGVGNTNIIGLLDRTIRDLNDKTIKLGNKAMVTRLAIGYGTLLQETPIYLGIEASYQLGNITLKRDISAPPNLLISTKITKKDTVSVHTKIGFAHQRAIFYGKIGVAHSVFNHSLINSGSFSLRKTYNNKFGVSGGGGVLYRLNNNWRAFVDYEVTKYPLMEFNLYRREAYKFKPTTYTFTTGMQYLF